MGDLLKTIKTATHKQMMEGMGAHFRFRGISVPIDPFLEGIIRTGRKVEYQLPLIAPDNKFNLDQDAVFDTTSVLVDRTPTWILSGGYVTIGERELHEVEDVSDGTILLTTPLLADHPAPTSVYHYSNPVWVEGAYAVDQTIINLDVADFLVRGDVIGISPDTDQYISFVEYRIVDLRYVGVGADNLNQYQVTLDRGIHRALTDNEVVQVLAYPAYISPILPVPQPFNAELPVVGPYLIDWLSAPFLNGMEVQEYQTIQQYNDVRLPIGSPTVIQKNHQILHVPIRADQLLWWEKICGTIRYDDGQNRLVAIPDDSGYWQLQYNCVPIIDVPFQPAKGQIITIAKSLLFNNEGFRIEDDVDAVQFEYQVDGTYVQTTETAATGTVTFTWPGTIPTDNDTVTLDDGFGNTTTFEFQDSNTFVQTDTLYRVVDIRTATNETDVAIELEAAVNAVTALGITADRSAPGPGVSQVDLTNDIISLLGNTTIVESTAGVRMVAAGFSGGTDRIETIDITAETTALEVAQQTAAAISRTDLHISAVYPTLAASVRLISTAEGTGGNKTITETVSDAGFIVQGMSGGSGGTTWNMQVSPAQDTLFRVRLYPNDYQDYTLLAGSITTIAINLDPADEPVERIELLAKGTPDTEILIGDLGIRGARTSSLQHSYVAHVRGERNFASSGLMVKPLFPSKEDLQVQYDTGASYDSGGVRL